MSKKVIFLMLISTLAFSCLNILVKSLDHFNVYQVVFFRSFGSILFTFPILIKKKIPVLGSNKRLLMLRSLTGFAAMTLFFVSLKYLSTGTSVSIRYLSPIFAALFSVVLLNERVKSVQWMYFFIAFSGVLFLKGICIDSINIGFVYIFISTILTAFVFIIIRKLKNDDHPLVIVNYFMVVSALIGGFLMLFNWITPKGIEWIYLLSLGVFGYFGQYYMTKAIQKDDISKVTPLKYLEVIFTMIIGSTLLNEDYTLLNLFGVFLIIMSLISNSLVKKL